MADVRAEHVRALVHEPEPDFHPFMRQPGAWTDEQWRRRRTTVIGPPDEAVSVYLSSAEDMILQKLAWHRMAGAVSDRQWRDVAGMLGVQRPTLDFPYLRRWAADLGITDLLEKAIEEADAT